MKLSRLVIASAAALSGLMLLTLAPTADGRGKPGGGGDTNFAFVFEVNDKGLFLTTIDDGNRVQLTSPHGRDPLGGKAADINPQWSPDLDPDTDGYQGVILYRRIRSDVDGLYVVNPDGSGNRLVAVESDAISTEWFAWTPNAKEIVVTMYPRSLIAVDVATGNLRVLAADIGSSPVHGISISPLGQLAFDAGGDIFLMDYRLNADGLIELDSTTVKVVTDPDTSEAAPSFSRDGTYLAYTQSAGFRYQIAVQDLLTGDERVVIEELTGWFRHVAWSPDDSQMVIHNRLEDSRSQDLILITDWNDPIGRQIINVSQTTAAHELTPDWKPDWKPDWTPN